MEAMPIVVTPFIDRVPVTRAMVHARTQELALLAGCAPTDVRQTHYEQAKREYTGESDLNRQNAVLDSSSISLPER